jgi:hypothetical protein
MRVVAAVVAVAAFAAVPAAADAATYLQDSGSNGARIITSGRTIQSFELYCAGKGNTETSFGNEFAFSMRDVVSLGRKGKFSYSGWAFRYGNEHQAAGQFKVKLSGRVTSSAARVTWSLTGCGTGTVTAARQNG